MLNINQILISFQIGVFSYIISSELIKPKHIFEFWGNWLKNLEKKHPKIAYPIGYCEKCLAGQIGLWYFLLTQPFNVIKLGVFISFCIITPIILKKLFYTKIN